jgi:hypothetical protein
MTSDGLTSVTGMKDEDLDVVGLKQEYQVSSVMSPMPTVFIFRLHVDIYYRFNKKKNKKNSPNIAYFTSLLIQSMALLLDFNSLFDYFIYLYYLTLKLPKYIWDEYISIEEFEDTKGVEGQTTQWPKEKGQKAKQRSTKYIYIKLKIE